MNDISIVISQPLKTIEVTIVSALNQNPIDIGMTLPGPKGEIGLQGEKGDKGVQGEKGDPGTDADMNLVLAMSIVF